MRLNEITKLPEASYSGNIGIMELVKFYRIATESQKVQMKELIANGSTKEAWDLLQQVTGVKLHDFT